MSYELYGVVLVIVISCFQSLVDAQDCDFEQSCSWEIKSGFKIVDYQSVSVTNPLVKKNPELHQWKGKFIICSHREGIGCQLESLLRVPGSMLDDVCLSANIFVGNENDSLEVHGHIELKLRSQEYGSKTGKTAKLSDIQIASWEPLTAKFYGPVGKHRLQIDVMLADNQSFVAVDDIKVDNCSRKSGNAVDDFKCDDSTFVKWDKVCNIARDCANGKDEDQALCGLMPHGSMCNFENGLCGWINSKPSSYSSEWLLHQGASPTHGTGPSRDHTLGTEAGKYLYIETNDGMMPDFATLHSMVLPGLQDNNPRCKLRFYYHMLGRGIGKLEVLMLELCKRSRKRTLWSQNRNQGDEWLYAEIQIPKISNWYNLRIEGHFGLTSHGDIAIDDVSISPECYGIQHNKTHFLIDSAPNNTISLHNFQKQLKDRCKNLPPRYSDLDNDTSTTLTTGAVTSVVEVHTQEQDQAYNISIGYIIIITVAGVLLMFGSGLLCFGVIKRRSQLSQTRRLERVSTNSDENCTNIPVQASSFDMQLRCAVTELNPNYDFITAKYPEQQLREIPRQSLSLTRLLGQGAFGEVYEGVLKNLCANVMELPVAVKICHFNSVQSCQVIYRWKRLFKTFPTTYHIAGLDKNGTRCYSRIRTLPALSSEQAETDFFMEAVIISKFMHKNVVKCLGVCFEEHPRYIVLELLQGGDLRSFLRDSRPKQTQSCQVTMEDLVKLALDIANGCRHLEEKHFVHRDIAARNCLLTSRDPGRIAKIADFGMSRDIYSADYYRKDGKAMLPIKWMPPEAFLDGVFTSKTDVWSFGILLWEIFTLGYMPYPGQTNSDVMHFVASGGRLDPPQNCPARLNKIMLMCWNSVADIRPAFSEIIDHLDMCLQDPEVIGCDMSVCHYPLAECLKDASVLVKSIPTDTSLEGESTTIPSEETTADYNGHVASQSREPLLPSPDESC